MQNEIDKLVCERDDAMSDNDCLRGELEEWKSQTYFWKSLAEASEARCKESEKS